MLKVLRLAGQEYTRSLVSTNDREYPFKQRPVPVNYESPSLEAFDIQKGIVPISGISRLIPVVTEQKNLTGRNGYRPEFSFAAQDPLSVRLVVDLIIKIEFRAFNLHGIPGQSDNAFYNINICFVYFRCIRVVRLGKNDNITALGKLKLNYSFDDKREPQAVTEFVDQDVIPDFQGWYH